MPANRPRSSARITAVLILALAAPVLSAAEAIPVSIQPLNEVLVDLQRSASAEVMSLNRATIAAEISGVIGEIHADVGSEVKAGDLLLEINPEDYRLALQQAEAGLATSKAQKAQADVRLQRARQLIEGKYLSADDLLARETEAQVANAQIRLQEAAVAIARRNLDKCRIVAPFSGAVSQRMAQTGSFVSPGTPLLVFAETDRIELDAEIPDEVADTLAQAQKIEFHSRNESWPLQLARLSPVIETEKRSRQARFHFTGSAPAVGRSGEVVWEVSQGLLPSNLVLQRQGKLGIFLAENGVARFHELPQAQEGRPVETDLPADTQVIVTGRERLQDGDPIKSL
ncbi:MAG TPA: efflux RND transporter periplasmic adaptor subunit [Xanthomonadales bacterium]|nr:efflux RND transporter periplasmic adaptor subunit [Xanthomonadales bacterium]